MNIIILIKMQKTMYVIIYFKFKFSIVKALYNRCLYVLNIPYGLLVICFNKSMNLSIFRYVYFNH